MPYSKFRLVFFCLALFLLSAAGSANAAEEVSPPPSNKFALLSRRLQFLSVDGYNQYRYADTGPGKVGTRDPLYKLSTVLRIKLVGEDRTYIQARGESGRSFTSSYD